MLNFDFSQNHFQLFGLPQQFALDRPQLDERYRNLQAQYHPDKAAHLADAEKRLALQAATQINEALQTLKSPLARGRYLLGLQGVDTCEETNTAMPMAFLMQQMQWREEIHDALRDEGALEAMAKTLRNARLAQEAELAQYLDVAADYQAAAGLVRQLKFMEKLEQEVDEALSRLLD